MNRRGKMSRIVEFEKNPQGKIIIADRYEILKFPSDAVHSGQSYITFSLDHTAAGRFITQKFYGVRSSIKETSKSKTLLASNSDYAQRVMRHEIDILRPLEAIFPSVPMLLTTGEYRGVPFANLSNGKESEVVLQDGKGTQFNLRDYEDGGVLSLEQIGFRNGQASASQSKRIVEIQNWDARRKLDFFLGFLKTMHKIHTDYGIINKDIKPAHMLILSPKYYGEPKPQIIDWASSIQKDHLDSMADFFIAPTTMAMNHPDILDMHRRILGKQTLDTIIRSAKRDARSLYQWDIWPLGICGLEFMTGRSPYINDAIYLISHNPEISEHKKELQSIFSDIADKTMDPDAESRIASIHEQIDAQKISCFIEAQERYFERRRKPGYSIKRRDSNVPLHVEKVLHSMLSEQDSSLLDLENVIHELTPHTYTAKQNLTRRVFCIKGIGGLAGLLAVGTGAYRLAGYMDSPSYLNNNLIKNMQERDFDKDGMKRLLRSMVENQMLAPIKETMKVIRSKGEFTSVPAKVENGSYQLDESRVLEAGYFPRLLLLSGLILQREDLIKDYLYVIDKLKFAPGEGYRIFRIMDPLQEFLEVSDSLGADFGLRQKSAHVLRECKEYILKEHLTSAEGLTYFKANTKDVPAKGYAHVIRPAYHIVRHMSDHAPEKFDMHMQALEKLIIDDGITYDVVSFNALGDTKPGVINTLKDVYDSIERQGFYGNACEQALMIDLFSFYNKKFAKGKDALDALWSRYSRNISVYGPSIEFLDAPKRIRSFNNSPFTVCVNSIMENPLFFGKDAVNSTLLLMHRMMDFSQKDGIIPYSRYETQADYSLTFRITSDYLALKSDAEFLKI